MANPKIFTPSWRLIDSPASGTGIGGSGNNIFPFLRRDILDDFGNYDQSKTNFLFTIRLFPREGIDVWNTMGDDLHELSFGLKKATRPSPHVIYEDVNYYNYRVKVATKVNFGGLDIEFYDDVQHRAHLIYTQYLNYISPITSINKTMASNLQNEGLKASTIGPYIDPNGPFEAIRITHHMLNVFSNNKSIPQQVFYDYINPKIEIFSPDGLDMTTSQTAAIKLSFVYDYVNISYSRGDAAQVKLKQSLDVPTEGVRPVDINPSNVSRNV